MAIDPVHVGTGGMRLGRVDNTIVREPGTNLPKIPGTALHGAIRAYAARRFGKIQCAGQKGHCGQDTCPICYTFGSISGQESYSGVISITDARILLFPVYSMVGPVWVSTVDILQEAGFQVQQNGNKVSGAGPFATFEQEQPLNLGWLMIEKPTKVTITDRSEDTSTQNKKTVWLSLPEPTRNRVILVSDKLFSQIVNSNLEVRTSVAINPETGAAEEGALYSYEAIPRATILWFDVIVDDFRNEFPDRKKWEEISNNYPGTNGLPDTIPDNELNEEKLLRKLGYIGERPENSEKKNEYWNKVKSSFSNFKEVMEKLSWENPIDIVNFGIEWLPHLGLGGMGTRGFGRVEELVYFKFKTVDFKSCEEKENE